MVRLDHDEDMGPMHGMYGALDPDLELQRTIKRADLTAFIRHFGRVVGPTTDHVDNKGIINGLWRGMHQIPLKPKALLKIFGTHVCTTRYEPRMSGSSRLLQNCLQQGFIPRSPAF